MAQMIDFLKLFTINSNYTELKISVLLPPTHLERERERDRERERERERERQPDRQTDRQTDRETDIQTDRDREGGRNTQIKKTI